MNVANPIPHAPGSHCESCPVYNSAQLTKLGIDMSRWDYVVALAGNPNTGKSTVFNALTGLRQHTGNWPGKTVVRAEGGFRFKEKQFKLVDLPGTYSLLSTSVDEEVARDFILFGRPDVTVVVVDATRLERNLNLVLQVLEITDRVVVALNLVDEAGRHGLTVDERSLARDLGVPVIPMTARSGEGIPELLQAIDEVARGAYVTKPHRITHRDKNLEAAVDGMASQLHEAFPGLPNARWVALRLIEGDPSIVEAVREGTLGDLSQEKLDMPLNLIPLEAVG
jgi:ferrous iron transport protein B